MRFFEGWCPKLHAYLIITVYVYAGYGVKKQYRKKTQNILSTKLYDRSIKSTDWAQIKPNQEGQLAVSL
jgi:hypothetical protein